MTSCNRILKLVNCLVIIFLWSHQSTNLFYSVKTPWKIYLLFRTSSFSCLSYRDLLAGSGSIDKVLTPEKLSRRSSFASVSFTPRTPTSNAILESPNESVESTITMLEVEILDLQSKCSSLISELGSSDSSEHVSDVKYLTEKLESMQTLLTRLRTLV